MSKTSAQFCMCIFHILSVNIYQTATVLSDKIMVSYLVIFFYVFLQLYTSLRLIAEKNKVMEKKHFCIILSNISILSSVSQKYVQYEDRFHTKQYICATEEALTSRCITPPDLCCGVWHQDSSNGYFGWCGLRHGASMD